MIKVHTSGGLYADDVVVLLHGLGRTYWSMHTIAKFLCQQGYRTINIGYPSRTLPLDEIVTAVHRKIQVHVKAVQQVHFVTHSYGGIIVRYYHQHYGIRHLGRVVMLSPPNKGSEIVDVLGKYAFFSAVLGPTAPHLGTGKNSVIQKLQHVNFDLGVITGNISRNPIFTRIMDKPSDGKVSVESAQVTGMNDFLVAPVDHTYIMQSKAIMHQVGYYLKHGMFDHDSAKHHKKNALDNFLTSKLQE